MLHFFQELRWWIHGGKGVIVGKQGRDDVKVFCLKRIVCSHSSDIKAHRLQIKKIKYVEKNVPVHHTRTSNWTLDIIVNF